MFNIKNLSLLIALFAIVFFTGCAKYYQVTDVSTGKVYYTENIDHKHGGAVEFKDSLTGAKVMLQSYSVKKVSKEEFYPCCEKNVKQPQKY